MPIRRCEGSGSPPRTRWLAFGAGLLSCAAAFGQNADFEKRIAPLLADHCLLCHGASSAQGGLRLDTREAASRSFVAGAPARSKLYTVIERGPGQPGAMPPGGPQLAAADREAIRAWIAAGASWPPGLTLGAAKPAAKTADDEALAARLRERIAANTKETRASDMKPYRAAIPGTLVSFEMTPIPGGEFTMGSPETEEGRSQDEGPTHRVKIEPFWMGKFEVTWDEYRLFMFSKQAGEVPGADAVTDAVSRPTRPYVEMSFGMGINGYPAISMTQHAANKYAEWLSARTGHFYRLPTEAEWEYACRAGSDAAFAFGGDAAKLGEYAVYAANSDGKYAKVGTKKPNAWGLHDMHGNVAEWTLDQYVPGWYATGGKDGAQAPSKTPYPHSVRGGSWNDDADRLRCGARMGSDPSWKMQDPQLPKSIWYFTDAQFLGFRLVRPLKVPSAMEMYRYWNNGVARE